MQYTITFTEREYSTLTRHLFENQTNESAAYLLCSYSVSDDEYRLLVREVVPVRETEIEDASPHHMTIPAPSFLRTIKRAHVENLCFVFVHSPPRGHPH